MTTSSSFVSRRRFLALSALGASAALLAACAPAAPPTSTAAPAPAAKPAADAPKPAAGAAQPTAAAAAPAGKDAITITVLQRNIPQDVKHMEDMAKRFGDKTPEIKVKVEVMPDDFDNVRQARLAAGTAGDIARNQLNSNYASDSLLGLLKQIDEYVTRDKYDLKQHLESTIQGLQMNGKLFSLPWDCHVGWSGVYCLQDLFDEAGVKIPTADWTYDDFVSIAQKLTKQKDGRPDQYGAWVGPSIPALLTVVSAHGGWYQNADRKKPAFDDAKTAAGFNWIVDAYQKTKISPANPGANTRFQLWTSKKVGMVLSGMWDITQLGDVTAPGAKWTVVHAPKGPGGKRGGILNVNLFPIWSSTKNPEQAWQFHKFLHTKEAGMAVYEALGEPGARNDVWTDPKLVNDPKIKPFSDIVNEVQPMVAPANGRMAELLNVVNKAMTPAYIGEKKAQDALTDMQQAAQKVMDQPPPGA